jgi:hypothetical protein
VALKGRQQSQKVEQLVNMEVPLICSNPTHTVKPLWLDMVERIMRLQGMVEQAVLHKQEHNRERHRGGEGDQSVRMHHLMRLVMGPIEAKVQPKGGSIALIDPTKLLQTLLKSL